MLDLFRNMILRKFINYFYSKMRIVSTLQCGSEDYISHIVLSSQDSAYVHSKISKLVTFIFIMVISLLMETEERVVGQKVLWSRS